VQGSPFLAISAWGNVRFDGLAFGARRTAQGKTFKNNGPQGAGYTVKKGSA
jgi:hypothetical protein